MVGVERQNFNARESIKAQSSFNNYPKWKHKLRENCYTRVQEDRTRLLWKLRSTQAKEHQEFVKSTFRDIVSDELQKVKVIARKCCWRCKEYSTRMFVREKQEQKKAVVQAGKMKKMSTWPVQFMTI
ncbi:unnamed protein product [Cuscuta campestris]|uniref:RPA-interacting protein N-terminal domain-containing protein n=1 Tax=Cuscuta campestris TaxID=132261 RepID=A0A484NKJ7_9ASTE|nr:unnamed protein product [Cuscuta campestris]